MDHKTRMDKVITNKIRQPLGRELIDDINEEN